jgi:hypothetical protein
MPLDPASVPPDQPSISPGWEEALRKVYGAKIMDMKKYFLRAMLILLLEAALDVGSSAAAENGPPANPEVTAAPLPGF